MRIHLQRSNSEISDGLHSGFEPFQYSITSLRPQRWALLRADLARAASSTVSNSTKAKPRCWPSIFLGRRIFLTLPYSENSSLSSFCVASKARFLTSNLLFLFSSFWIFSLRAFRSSTLCTFFLERLSTSLCPSTNTLLSRLIASSAFSGDSISTKPKPMDWPCLFLTILAYLMGAIFSKISWMALSSVSKFRFLMQTTLLSSPASSSSFSARSMLFTMLLSLIIPSGAYYRYRKLFLNLWFWRFFITFSANSGLWNSAMAMALLGAIITLSIIPQNYSSSLSSVCWVRQLRFLMRRVCLLLSQRLRSFYRKSRLMLPSLAIHSRVSWITSASARATLGARLLERRISDLVMCSFLAILSRMVLGLRKSVFQLVVSFNLSLISLFFFFLQDDFYSVPSPYFSFIFYWYSASFPVLITSPMSSREGLMWMMRPKTTLLSSSAKARRAYYDFWQVMKKKPLLLPSYYLGSLILVMLPKRENAVFIYYSVSLQGMFVMQRRVESTSKGFVTNFLFFSLKRGAFMGFTYYTAASTGFFSFFYFFSGNSTFSAYISPPSTLPFPFRLLFLPSSSGSAAGCSGTRRSSQDFLVCSWMIFLYPSKVFSTLSSFLSFFSLCGFSRVLDRSCSISSLPLAISILTLLAPKQVLSYFCFNSAAVSLDLNPTNANRLLSPPSLLATLQSVISSTLLKWLTISFSVNTLGTFLMMILLMSSSIMNMLSTLPCIQGRWPLFPPSDRSQGQRHHRLWLVFLMKCMFSITPPFRLYFSLSSMPSCFTKPFQSSLLFPTEFILRLRLQMARMTWFRYWQAMVVFLLSNSQGFYSWGWCSINSQLCFFSMISSCPVSSLRMNSFPAKTTRLLGFMDSELSIFCASYSGERSYEGLIFFLRESSYSSFISLQSAWMDCYAALAITRFSCYWRQRAYSCLVGLQSSSYYDSQSWKYLRSMPPNEYIWIHRLHSRVRGGIWGGTGAAKYFC